MKAIILAAGSGSRLAPLGITTPKSLIPILNKPILHHQIDAISELVEEAIVVIGSNDFGEMIKKYIAQQNFPIKVSTAMQDEPLGTANGFQAAQKYFNQDDQVLCLLGDDLYSLQDLKSLTAHTYAILGQQVEDWEKWGILQVNNQQNVTSIIEKPDTYVGNLANTGAAVVTAEIFELYHQIKPSSRGEYEFTDILSLIAKNHAVKAVQVQDYWLPIGYPWHILTTTQTLLNIHKIKSPVIGSNPSIGQNVTISNNSVIGHNVTIEDGAVIENTVIFDNVSIGSNSHLSHSVIGKNVVIWPGFKSVVKIESEQTIHSDIKNIPVDTKLQTLGVIIGNNATIGRNTTIHPSCKIWPNCKIKNGNTITKDVAV